MGFEVAHVQLGRSLWLLWLMREELRRCGDGGWVEAGWHGGGGFVEAMREVDKVGCGRRRQRGHFLREAIREGPERIVPQQP